MAEKKDGLVYRRHPLRRVGKMIYYGSMSDSHIILMQVKETRMDHDICGAAAHGSGLEEPRPGG